MLTVSKSVRRSTKYFRQRLVVHKEAMVKVQFYLHPNYRSPGGLDRRFFCYRNGYGSLVNTVSLKPHSDPRSAQAPRNYSYRIFQNPRAKWKFLGGLIFATGILSSYEFYSFRTHLTEGIPRDVAAVGGTAPGIYVYILDQSPWYLRLFPWKSACEAPVWHYIAQTKSHDPDLREEAIKKLVSLKGSLTEAECATVASAIDFKTAVILAHAGAKPSMVSRPAMLHPDKQNMSLAEKFREILTALPPESIHEAIFNASFAALRMFQPTDSETMDHHMDLSSGFLNEFSTIMPVRTVPEESFLRPCLQALLSHSRIKEQIPTLVKSGAMDLLLVISQKYKTDHDIMGTVVKILSSFTCSEESDKAFEESGMLRVIVECAANDDVRLSYPARKALRNLDRDNYRYTLPPGLYQVYPDSRNEDNYDLDVIFVHGLMGGAFRTWRSQDLSAVWRLKRNTDLLSGKEGLCEQPPSPSTLQRGADFLRQKILEADKNPVHNTIISVHPPTGGSIRERFESQLKSIPRRLLSPPEKEILPKNREMRNGTMYYFRDEEEIPLELEIMPMSPITKCWPRDWLPIDFANIRVICADFETFITHWNPVMPVENLGRTIHERSDELVEKLARAGIGERPIVWVCHSAGGVITKHMLTLVDSSDNQDLKRIASMTRGAVFCSTPHFGSRIMGVGKSGRILLPTVEILELMKDSIALVNINSQFESLMTKYSYKIISFGELCPTFSTVGISRKLVPVDSSDPGYGDYYGLKVDHLNICKPRSRNSFVYVKIRDLIYSILNSNSDSAPDADKVTPEET